MADLTYGEIKNSLIGFLEYKVERSYETPLRLINRAVRYIENYYNGEWNHLFVRDYATTVDSTGYLITLPSNFNKLYAIFKNTKETNIERGETDFRIEVVAPTVLTAALTRRIHYWNAKNSGEARYLSYWRNALLFAGSDNETPDIWGSGEAILATAEWLGIRNERAAEVAEKNSAKEEAIEAIRKLKATDHDSSQENSPPDTSINNDAHIYENYNLEDGGSSDRPSNPFYND